jgi:hypothetical protein
MPAGGHRALCNYIGVTLMLRIIILVIAFLLEPALSAKADMSDCSQLSNLSTARLRWTATRKSRVDSAQSEETCRSYSSNFFEAVTARQTAFFCAHGVNRQRILELLDSEIDAFNDLIATHCSIQ